MYDFLYKKLNIHLFTLKYICIYACIYVNLNIEKNMFYYIKYKVLNRS